MSLAYRTRRRLALLILLVGLPAYIVAAVTLMNALDTRFGRLPIWAEVAVYVGLGFLWALPFRFVFRGVGQADPDAPRPPVATAQTPAAPAQDEGRP